MPCLSIKYSSTPGSSDPQRVPIGTPSAVEKPIVAAMLMPPFMAHMLAPLPRWATTVRPSAAWASMPGSTEAMYS